jgi:phage host-nuclease inhibitor protein Gam
MEHRVSLTEKESRLAKLIGDECGESAAHVLAKAVMLNEITGLPSMGRVYVQTVRDQLTEWLETT